MITAICLNPCIDKTVKIESWKKNGLNRVLESRLDGSGKGVNVAIACRQIGLDSACTGFLYKRNGDIIQKRLDDNGVISDFVWNDGEVRTNLKIADLADGTYTEVNERGVPVTEEQLAQVKEKIKNLAPSSEIMVFTGSLPPGCPKDFYKQLIEAVSPYPVKCILDAEGEVLTKGVEAVPFLIKPNLFELEKATGLTLSTMEEIYKAAMIFIKKGVTIVAVSMGGDGAFITNGKEAYYAPAMQVEVKSTVGAGDSMVAGFCKALHTRLGLKDIFRYGVAGASASVITEGTQLIDTQSFDRFIDKVIIQEI